MTVLYLEPSGLRNANGRGWYSWSSDHALFALTLMTDRETSLDPDACHSPPPGAGRRVVGWRADLRELSWHRLSGRSAKSIYLEKDRDGRVAQLDGALPSGLAQESANPSKKKGILISSGSERGNEDASRLSVTGTVPVMETSIGRVGLGER